MARPYVHALDRPHAILAADHRRIRPPAVHTTTVTALRFALPHPIVVDVHVLDMAGVRVRTLSCGELSAGEHECGWDGFDEAGSRCPTGSYVLRLETDGSLLTSRIVALC